MMLEHRMLLETVSDSKWQPAEPNMALWKYFKIDFLPISFSLMGISMPALFLACGVSLMM